MNMIRPTSVMAWNDGIERQDTVTVAALDATKSSVIDICCICRVTVPVGHDAAVDSLSRA